MITLKRNPIVDTKMIKRKQSKHITTKTNKTNTHKHSIKSQRKREREEQKIENLTDHSEQMAIVSYSLSVITLNRNRLNSPSKRHSVAE